MKNVAAQGFTFELPLPPRELNPNSRNGRSWQAAYDAKRMYRAAATFAICSIKRQVTFARARISYDVYWPKGRRMLDYDNFLASCKVLQDCLVREGLIVNDSPRYLELGGIRYHRDETECKLVVTVEEA